ncbi:MAG: bifunctional phosphoserine phosphatase/homoserine phosphotransferase ThrH [Deltaproteobacteria bacterium]|nr:MAG: bifunctional phosphoserine phosphatase/homoserine phosphotransferase ThrH [Deltaproteobacteria bacterium]
MRIACLDLEGILTPEIWIDFAEHTGISELRMTTRDEPDYDVLMRKRLAILEAHGLGLPEIEGVIARMEPLPGAPEFLAWLRRRCQVIVLSDTFYEFAQPLMAKLGDPTLLCHRLEIDEAGRIRNYVLRQKDAKRAAVRAFQALNFEVVAVGDSYNDTTMLAQADAGILFRPPPNVVSEFPHFPVTHSYEELEEAFLAAEAHLDRR